MNGRSRRCQEPEGTSQELTEGESLKIAGCCGSSCILGLKCGNLFICVKLKKSSLEEAKFKERTTV